LNLEGDGTMDDLLTEDQMRRRLREKYREPFQHCWTLLELAQEVLGDFKGAAQTPYQRSMFLIAGRAFKSYHAILNLCEIAYTEDAGIILRSLFQLFVITRWLKTDTSEDRARKYLGWFWVVMHEEVEQDGTRIDPGLVKLVAEQYKNHEPLFTYTDKDGKRKMRRKWYEPEARSLEDMASQVELQNQYDGLYRPLSSIEHSDAVAYFGMISEMETKSEGSALSLHSDMFVPAYLRNAFQYFAEIFNRWNRTFRGVDEQDLTRVIDGGMSFFKQEMQAD